MPRDKLVPWMRTIATTLDFVHGRKTIDRDVKPANVIFDGEGHVYLSDFGVAKALEGEDANLTEAGMHVDAVAENGDIHAAWEMQQSRFGEDGKAALLTLHTSGESDMRADLGHVVPTHYVYDMAMNNSYVFSDLPAGEKPHPDSIAHVKYTMEMAIDRH